MMATMRCDEELVQLYVDGTLHPAEAALVEAHLRQCRACRRLAGFYKSLYWDLGRTATLAPDPAQDPDALAEVLLAEHRRHRQPEAPPASAWAFSTLWLTANPAFARPARTLTALGHRGAEGLVRTLKRRWRRRKGGG
ncbi:MAG: hypothetical protein CWE10_06550 [Symbiobacterium thermophilum]|jgi:predicted anti-sigma-YlaC factor YlaD|nr:hypothetical protein [Symbiobacterium thermophilum]